MATERRRKQVARRIQQRVGNIFLHEMKDPRAVFLTVTGVEINSDLTMATVRYTVLGEDADRRKMKSLLKHAHGFIRTEVAHALDLRSAPDLVFEYDEGVERATRINEILREVLPGAESEEDEEPDAE